MPTELRLPELGENVTAGDVVRILVKPGDGITKDQPVLELETDKATIEVPSSLAGIVKDVKVKAGEKVKVGQAILVVDEGADGSPQARPAAAGPKPQPEGAAEEGGHSQQATAGPRRRPPDSRDKRPQADGDEEQAAPAAQRARQPPA